MSGSVDVGFILALTFHHGDLEPDYVGVSTRGEGGLMHEKKILCAKNAGGAYARGGRICGTIRYLHFATVRLIQL